MHSIEKNPERRLDMVIYKFYFDDKFYFNDGREEDSLIGILPERRKSRRRVTRKSIMKWGKLAAGGNVDPSSIYYVKLDL